MLQLPAEHAYFQPPVAGLQYPPASIAQRACMLLQLLAPIFDGADLATGAAVGAVAGVAVVCTIVRQCVWMVLPTRFVVQVLVRVCANASATNAMVSIAAMAATSIFLI